MRIGIGYDSHRLVRGRKLIVGGVEIPFDKGLEGHSDADILCHSIIDALLGASGMGDIGQFFPDDDPAWKDFRSLSMVEHVVGIINDNGFKIIWIDSVILAEKPKLSPYIEEMKKSLSMSGIGHESISIKAKTNEGLGFIGRGEGIAAISTCLLQKT